MLAAIGEQIFAAADPREHLGEELSRHDRRHLSISRSFEGMGEVTGRLDPEATERAVAVLDALAQKAGPDDGRTAAQRRADAFDTMCTAWLASGSLPAPADGTPRRDQVIVTIPYQTLLGLPGAPAAVLGDGTPITAETARRLACDASIRRVVVVPPAWQQTCPCGHTCSWAAGANGHTTPAAQATGKPDDHTTANGHTTPDDRGELNGSATAKGQTAANGDRASDNTNGPDDDAAVNRAAAPDGHTAAGNGHTPAADMPSAGPGHGGNGCAPRKSLDPTARLTAILRKALASLPPPLGARSAVLDVGRATPTFTAPIKNALHAEYGGRCAFPRCGKRATVNHHVVHWAHGGRTSVANGAPLCDFHHYLVHEGGWHLDKDRHGAILAVPPPPTWPGPRKRWRNGRPIAGGPATT